MATGPHKSEYQIPELVVSDTFHDWFQVTNQEIINKLNRMSVYTIGDNMDGIDGITLDDGTVRFEISDHITKGITFDGDLVFNGTVTRINSTEFSIDDYNIILGDTGPQGSTSAGTGASDNQILAGGGGGLLLARNDGDTASWLWQPGATSGGLSGAWESNSHIQLNAAARFLSGENVFRFESGSSGEHLDIRHQDISGATGRWGLSGAGYGSIGTGGLAGAKVWGLEDDLVLSYGNSGGGTLEFMRIHDDGYVDIHKGVNKKRIRQDYHSFKFGDAVRLDSTTGYTWGIANSEAYAEVLGLVSYVHGHTFDITYSGEIRGHFGDALGTSDSENLLAGNAYFLSPHEYGKLTVTRPDTVNFVQKPMLLATGTGEGLVVNYLGGVVAEDMVADASTSQRLEITATADYFQMADVVRVDKDSRKYVRAQCNNDEEAEALGVITRVAVGGDTEKFYLTTSGIVSFGVDDIGPNGMIPGQVYFLNSNCAAAFGVTGNCLTTDDPDTVGFVRKPMFTAISPTQASLLNYIGTRISDDSYVASDGSSEGSGTVNTIFTAKRVYFETQKYLHNGEESDFPHLGCLAHGPSNAGAAFPFDTQGPATMGVWRWSGQYESYSSSAYSFHKYWGIFDLSEIAMGIPHNATHAIFSVYYEDDSDPGASQLLYNAGGEESVNKITIASAGPAGDAQVVEVPIGADRKCFLTGFSIGAPAAYVTVIGYITSDQLVGNYAGEEIDIETEKTTMLGNESRDLSTGEFVGEHSIGLTKLWGTTDPWDQGSGMGVATLTLDLFGNDFNIPSNATHVTIKTRLVGLGANFAASIYYSPTEQTTWAAALANGDDKIIINQFNGAVAGESHQSMTEMTVPLHSSGKCVLYISGGDSPGHPNGYDGDTAYGIISGYITNKTTTIQSGAISNIDGDNNRRANLNGNFDIWQRMTEVTPYTWQFDDDTNKYMADRWHSMSVADNKVHAERREFEYGAGKVSGTDYLPEANSMPARYYLNMASTGPDSDDAGSPSIQTVIEDATLFHGKKCSFSFWLKGDVHPLGSNVTTFDNQVKLRVWQYLGIVDGEAYGASVLGAGITATHAVSNPVTTSKIVFNDTWQKFSGSITLPSIAGVQTPSGYGPTAGVGCLGCEFIVSEDAEGWTGDFSIAQFQFEVGGAVTKFESKTPWDELSGCQRYYQIACGGFDTADGAGDGNWGAGTTFLVEMRKIKNSGGRPTCVAANIGDTDDNIGTLGTYVNQYDATHTSDVLARNHRGFILSKTKPDGDGAYFSTYAFTADF